MEKMFLPLMLLVVSIYAADDKVPDSQRCVVEQVSLQAGTLSVEKAIAQLRPLFSPEGLEHGYALKRSGEAAVVLMAEVTQDHEAKNQTMEAICNQLTSEYIAMAQYLPITKETVSDVVQEYNATMSTEGDLSKLLMKSGIKKEFFFLTGLLVHGGRLFSLNSSHFDEITVGDLGLTSDRDCFTCGGQAWRLSWESKKK